MTAPDLTTPDPTPPKPDADAILRRALLYPETVALIGASDTAGRLTARPQTFLARHGFAGVVHPVNPRRAAVQGVPAHARIQDVPGPVDHAYILLDAEPALRALEDCAEAGVRVATVLADGFAEAGGEGLARQARLEAIAAASGTLVVGPNSTGVVETSRGFACTTNAAFAAEQMPTGDVAVLSQSGSVIGAMLSRGAAAGVGFRAFVSVGNEACAGVGEIGALLVDDPGVNGFVLFLETLRRPDAFARFAAAARAAGKPVVAYLVGRSEAGRVLATSHTGAMVGGARALEAFLRAQGVHVAETFEGAISLPQALKLKAQLAGRPRRGTVLTTTGGGGGMVYDRIGMNGIALAGMGASAAAALEAEGIDVKPGPLVDVTLAGARYEVMRPVVSALANDPATGLVVAVIGSSAQFQPELAVRPIVDAVAAAGPDAAPVIAAPVPHAPESLALLAAGGVPAFRTPEGAAEAVAALLRPDDPPTEEGPSLPEAMRDALATLPRGRCNEVEAADVFAALGIPAPLRLLVGALEELPETLPFGGPYVLKAVSRDLPHKSEAGGVALALADRKALEEALRAMRARLAKPVEGYLVQPMLSGRGEVVLGLVRDPVVGPMVSVGAGGVLTELYADVALRPAPVSPRTARAMLDEVTALVPLRGYRGLPEGDLEALAEAVSRFSALAHMETVREAEINPLLVRAPGQGVAMLDALLDLEAGPEADRVAAMKPAAEAAP